jgi:hypothetical protein
LSLLEAMGHGMVPVVSDLPSGIGEVVDEHTGIRVPPQNVPEYAAAIVRLHQNRDKLRELSRHAREKVHREFSVAAMTDRWLASLPATTSTAEAWPQTFRIRPILGVPHPWRFTEPVRTIRRILIRRRR